MITKDVSESCIESTRHQKVFDYLPKASMFNMVTLQKKYGKDTEELVIFGGVFFYSVHPLGGEGVYF